MCLKYPFYLFLLKRLACRVITFGHVILQMYNVQKVIVALSTIIRAQRFHSCVQYNLYIN